MPDGAVRFVLHASCRAALDCRANEPHTVQGGARRTQGATELLVNACIPCTFPAKQRPPLTGIYSLRAAEGSAVVHHSNRAQQTCPGLHAVSAVFRGECHCCLTLNLSVANPMSLLTAGCACCPAVALAPLAYQPCTLKWLTHALGLLL